MGMLRKQLSSLGYTRIDECDPDERRQRQAQFLIYKTLQKADHIAKQTKSTTLIRLRFFKVGRRLKQLRRGVMSSLSRARAGLSKRVSSRLQGLGWGLRSCATSSSLPTPLVAYLMPA